MVFNLINLIYIIIYVVIYYIMVIFLFIERFFRFGKKSKDLKATETDDGTTKLLGIAFSVCMLLLFATIGLNYFTIGLITTNSIMIVLGFFGMMIGMLIRLQSVRTLGAFYTSTLQTGSDQILVDTGMYHYIRNPGYLGNIILFISTCIALTNIISLVIIPCILIPAYLRRITSEEKMLAKSFGESFQNYKLRTKRLIPFIY